MSITLFFKTLFYFLVFLLFSSCKSFEAGHFDFPRAVDTSTRAISMQEKETKSFPEAGIHLDNEFDGARMNLVTLVNESKVRVAILPENSPINESPFYAFRIWTDQAKDIQLELIYPGNKHRYYPKLSNDGKSWERMNPEDFDLNTDSSVATLKLKLTSEKLWVAGQELLTSTHTKNWCEELATDERVSFKAIGESKLGRQLFLLDIFEGAKEKKEMVVILSRQHPPEVTGYMAMESFVEELLEINPLSKDFVKKFRILVFPMMNPDGVDLGHWRHNAGGIDLNRDWAYFRQPETKQVADYMVAESKRSKNKVILGLDFHSTYRDLYYTMNETTPSTIAGFKDYWLDGIGDSFGDYEPDDIPGGISQPISKGWFYLQFNAESVTYEIGDETLREFVKEKGRVAAKEMMKLLVLRN